MPFKQKEGEKRRTPEGKYELKRSKKNPKLCEKKEVPLK